MCFFAATWDFLKVALKGGEETLKGNLKGMFGNYLLRVLG